MHLDSFNFINEFINREIEHVFGGVCFSEG